jgi:lipopolysaccharide biosynthesis regulator YciM
MMQLVIWLVVATVNPAGARASDEHFHGWRYVASYTTEAECQKHARSANDSQQRVLSQNPQLNPQVISEIYHCYQEVVKTECHNYKDGRC